jgi:NAD(P)-dependent dehydrogenase (short-subunit alcohol dehydrogenase family)
MAAPSAAGRSVLLTGASDGIGLAVAREMLARGDRVRGLSRRPSPLSGQPGFSQVLHDLADLRGIPAAVGELSNGLERLDLIVLNAAVSNPVADLADTPIERFEHSMAVNTWANKQLLDAVFARGIRVTQVIAVSSGAAVNGSRGWNAYAVSKAAFVMLIALYAAERPETHFCSLAPGIVQTRMQDDLAGATPEEIAKYPSLQRLLAARGTPEMPSPSAAAPRLLAAFDQARRLPSGSFVKLESL